jgi:glycosyltransferase involved in cell wall biosynthesis
MHWDVLFLEATIAKHFDNKILAKKPLGGTEATIIRVAEGLGATGLKVAVVQTRCAAFRTKKGEFCTFIHGDNLPANTSCDHYVELRDLINPNLFPKAKKYLWLHNPVDGYAPGTVKKWLSKLLKYKTTVIGVSKWHVRDLKKVLPNVKLTYLYNPVPDEAYISLPNRPQYDKNVIVWPASPHKGLERALELHQKIREKRPTIKLYIFNPRYVRVDTKTLAKKKGVYYLGGAPCFELWKVIKKSLCVFYPINQNETFGCIGSESNALGTPLVTYARGGIEEVVSSKTQLVKNYDEPAVIKKVIAWHDKGRPTVYGRKDFMMGHVIKNWIRLFQN